MGMAWDTGAPVWPYQTPDILLRFLNGPAYFVAQPLANVFRLGGPNHFLMVFPAILIWWWFLGVRLDSGWGTVKSRWRRPASALLAISAVVLLCTAIVVSRHLSLVGRIRQFFQDRGKITLDNEVP